MQILGQSLKFHGGPVALLWITANSCSTSPSGPASRLGKNSRRKLPEWRDLRSSSDEVNLKSLTARVGQLTRRRQLSQIFEEIEIAKEQHGKLNKIVMNAVMEACVHCGDIESALKLFDEMSNPEGLGVDGITYGTLLKGLGNARRFNEAFQLLEAVEKGTAAGRPQLSAALICSLLNALIESGDLLRANCLLVRYGYVIQEGGSQIILAFNLLMKGYITSGNPSAALGVHEEILKHGLSPDQLSYNTLIFACIRNGNLDAARLFFEQMKVKGQKSNTIFPDLITYTTLIQGFGNARDISSLIKIFTEMKSSDKLRVDRVAYTASVDALLNCGSLKAMLNLNAKRGGDAHFYFLIHDALCVFGEIIKQYGSKPNLRPKPHLFLSLMRAFAACGDYNMVRRLQERIWLDSAGTITSEMQSESDLLLMEAALNQGQVDMAMQKLENAVWKWRDISWSSRGAMVALRLEALMGLNTSVLSPRVLPQVLASDAIESIMIPFDEASPLHASMQLKQVAARLFKDRAIPIIDECGHCVGILHRDDCDELDATVSTLMRSPPPYVMSSTSVSCAIDHMLEKRYEMVVIVEYDDFHELSTASSLSAIGVFTHAKLCQLTLPTESHDALSAVSVV